jgi:uncharacterized membrane protein
MRAAVFWLGFALGGFFDGILLHQVLQWHHLLSLWAPEEGLPFHIWWDGMFHAAHYAIAAGALVALWRRRADAARPGAGRLLAGVAFLGFGAWHVLDVVLNHWILQMHRTRLDVADPLPWDLGLLAVGLAAAAIGWLILRRPGGGAGRAVAVGLAALTLLSAPVAALPPRDPDPVVAALLAGAPLPAFCASWSRYAAR